jgi:uncharacterized protein (TIGR00369 family)
MPSEPPAWPDRAALIAFFERAIPFNLHLGMRVERLEPGDVQIRVPFRPELVGDPYRPALHGGVLSTLGDATGGLAVFSTLRSLEARVSTVDLRIDYLRPARLEDVVCEASVLRAGNRVAVTRMLLTQAGGHVVAECRGVYNIRGERQPGERRDD